MTRLREALEKAVGQSAVEQPVTPTGTRPFADTAQLVPDTWDLGRVEEEAVQEMDHVLRSPLAGSAAEAADVSLDTAARPANSNQSADLWATYRFSADASTKVVVGPSPNAALVEQYRRLGAALHHHQLQGGAHTVMVTSAVASEGKTLTATNLALTLSHSYKRRVLLIDADLRQPGVHEVLSLPNTVGLTDSLKSGDRSTLRVQTLSPLFSVLTAGRPDSDPMAGLVSDTMSQILTDAAEQFDWVIVDTPPVALLPDANLLAAMIDTALVVVSANTTPYPLVARAVQAIGEQRILGVVLNRMAYAEMMGAYDGYGYGYGGQYHSGVKQPSRRRFLPFFNRVKQEP